VLFYGEQQKFPQIGAKPLFMRLAIPFTGTSIQRPDLFRSFYFWATNGSPAPLFETDDDRLSFLIRLPRHPLALVPPGDSPQVTPQVLGSVGWRRKRATRNPESRQIIVCLRLPVTQGSTSDRFVQPMG